MDTKFQNWLMAHQPSDNMLWKDAFWHTYVFWRDIIIPMFNPVVRKGYEEYKEFHISDIDAFTDVVGEHWSKSIINPVLKITYKGATLIFRYNFYDYEVAVISSKDLNLPQKNLFYSKDTSFYFQGFPDEYQLTNRYEFSKKQFMAHLNNHYDFYTFMFLIKTELDKPENQDVY